MVNNVFYFWDFSEISFVGMIQFEVCGFVQQYSFYFNLDIFRYLLHVFMQQNRSESLFMEGVENERYENYQSE
jgi:hypothetical protein